MTMRIISDDDDDDDDDKDDADDDDADVMTLMTTTMLMVVDSPRIQYRSVYESHSRGSDDVFKEAQQQLKSLTKTV